jgi:aspartyl aminopeptidase
VCEREASTHTHSLIHVLRLYLLLCVGETLLFEPGATQVAGNGFTVVGAHTDSPCLKVRAPLADIHTHAFALICAFGRV